MKTLRFVTSNPHKFREAETILGNYGFRIEWIELKYPEIQADTLKEIVLHSLKWLSERVEQPFFIEDAGLFIHSLNGFPGPYSSYVFKTLGNEGILKLMEDIKDRRATFKSVIGLAVDDKHYTFCGETNGFIAQSIRGALWGFDPIFIPEGVGGLTYAELGDKKNLVSHRRKSLELMASWFSRKVKKP
ncbi:MAG TPA: XTP/dITP diphosphatase [Candidatus Korarchaeota archaeon]|nr:XTP/dITP diphosphatase [Candidatus Korarchaeota archaeon]